MSDKKEIVDRINSLTCAVLGHCDQIEGKLDLTHERPGIVVVRRCMVCKSERHDFIELAGYTKRRLAALRRHRRKVEQ